METDAALEAVFIPVKPLSTFEETVERLGTAIRLGFLAPDTKLEIDAFEAAVTDWERYRGFERL